MPGSVEADEAPAPPPTVVFRGESSSLKKLLHTLAKTCQVTVGDESADANVIVCSSQPSGISSLEIEEHLNAGGSLLFLLSGASSSELPAFLRKVVGVTVHDEVVSLSHSTDSLHPRHVVIADDGAVHDDFIDAGVRSIIYPEGTSLNVAKGSSSAVTVISSGSDTFPTNRPLAVAWQHDARSCGGRVVVIGSTAIFSDAFLKAKDNAKLCHTIFQFLLRSSDRVTFSPGRATGVTIDDDNPRPDIAALAHRIKPCLSMLDPLPQDLTELYCDDNLFGFDTDTVTNLYRALEVPREPLKLIQPEFESVMPPLRPAVFAPQIELPPPQIELFNLDEACADRHTKLGQVTNDSLNEGTSAEEFVQRAGAILGVTKDESASAKEILSLIFGRIVQAQARAEDRLPVLHVSTF